MTDEELAKLFHDTYESLAPHYNYKTREASAVSWDNVPENNKNLMLAVARVILANIKAQNSREISQARVEQAKVTATHFYGNGWQTDNAVDIYLDELDGGNRYASKH